MFMVNVPQPLSSQMDVLGNVEVFEARDQGDTDAEATGASY